MFALGQLSGLSDAQNLGELSKIQVRVDMPYTFIPADTGLMLVIPLQPASSFTHQTKTLKPIPKSTLVGKPNSTIEMHQIHFRPPSRTPNLGCILALGIVSRVTYLMKYRIASSDNNFFRETFILSHKRSNKGTGVQVREI